MALKNASFIAPGNWSEASNRKVCACCRICAAFFEASSGYTSSGTFLLPEMKPPRLTQICCASGVSSHWMRDSACGVSLNMPTRSPPPVTEPVNWVLMSGNGKKSKSPSLAPASFLKKSVMNDAWWWNRQPGGVANIGFAALPKFVFTMNFVPPYAFFRASPKVCHACLISGLVHFWVPWTHASYTCGPLWRRTMSSSQSVPGHPDAAPDSSPMHHSLVSPVAVDVASWLSSSQDFGAGAVVKVLVL